ncbi:phage capsid protein [Phenylobacterium sp.]|uniref:phage capsid protein n=1 Tax=Phenylobacterium sp. TaxID=1871053 RepID=UPI002DE4ADB7|nr:phage capsid protein [Phenylobacterium sp.]
MADNTGATAGTLYVPGFQANLNLSPQQSRSRLLTCVDSDLGYSTPGQFFNADDVGTSDPADVTTRVPDSPDGFVDVTRRIGTFKGFNDGKFIDNEDLARQLEDPTNLVMQAMMAGLGRKRDTAIISAALGAPLLQDNNQNYVAGTTLATVGNVIAANDATSHENETIAAVGRSGGYGLTIGKLIEVKTQLDNSEIDEPTPGDKPSDYYFACTANQLQDLLMSVPATSSFYNSVQGLVNGTLSYFMGFNFVRLASNKISNPLPKYQGAGAGSATTRQCLAFHKRALLYRGRPIIQTRITQRADKAYRWYAYYESEHGAVRRYDGGVWEVDCAENTTGFN